MILKTFMDASSSFYSTSDLSDNVWITLSDTIAKLDLTDKQAIANNLIRLATVGLETCCEAQQKMNMIEKAFEYLRPNLEETIEQIQECEVECESIRKKIFAIQRSHEDEKNNKVVDNVEMERQASIKSSEQEDGRRSRAMTRRKDVNETKPKITRLNFATDNSLIANDTTKLADDIEIDKTLYDVSRTKRRGLSGARKAAKILFRRDRSASTKSKGKKTEL